MPDRFEAWRASYREHHPGKARRKQAAPTAQTHTQTHTHTCRPAPSHIHQNSNHTEWEHRLWTEAVVAEAFPEGLRNQAAFDAAPNFGEKADILRYEVRCGRLHAPPQRWSG